MSFSVNSGSHSHWNKVIIILWQGWCHVVAMCKNAYCKAQYNDIQKHRLIHYWGEHFPLRNMFHYGKCHKWLDFKCYMPCGRVMMKTDGWTSWTLSALLCIATSQTSYEYSIICVFVNSHTLTIATQNNKYVMCSGIARILKLCLSTTGISICIYVQVNSRKNDFAKQTNSKSKCISCNHIGKYVCCIATSLCVCLNIQ